jgi:hypothetical protein
MNIYSSNPCPSGYYCLKMTDDVNVLKLPCPIGYYCPIGTNANTYD